MRPSSRSVDILQRQGNVLNLIEVKSISIDGVLPDESPFRGKMGAIDRRRRKDLEDVSFQQYILARAFPTLTIVPYLCVVDKSRAATANSTYEHFRLERVDAYRPEAAYTGDVDALQHEHVLATVTVSKEVDEILPELEPDIERFAKTISTEPFKRIPPQVGQHCKGCEYRDGFRDCWQDLADAVLISWTFTTSALWAARMMWLRNLLLAEKARCSTLSKRGCRESEGAGRRSSFNTRVAAASSSRTTFRAC